MLTPRKPAPLHTPTATAPVVSCYVDNVCIIGLSRESVDAALHKVDQAFRRKGFRTHDIEPASDEFEAVGVRFLGRQRLLVLRPERTWRLHLASLATLGQGDEPQQAVE